MTSKVLDRPSEIYTGIELDSEKRSVPVEPVARITKISSLLLLISRDNSLTIYCYGQNSLELGCNFCILATYSAMYSFFAIIDSQLAELRFFKFKALSPILSW